MKNNKRFLIVGQGLAGTILADSLIQKKQSVYIIDRKEKATSSRVAGGVVNPITGRRFNVTWKASTLLPHCLQYYRTKEQELGESFYHEIPIYRFFSSIEDQNTYMAKTADPVYKLFLSGEPLKLPENIYNSFGGFAVKGGGWLNTEVFLDAMEQYFLEKKILLQENFDFKNLEIQEDNFKYNNHSFDFVIFCEGYHAINNPYFHWLPFAPAKGELFHISSKEIPEHALLNKNGFILPLGNQKFKVGATYRWNELNQQTTERSKQELIEKLEKITSASYSIDDHLAGIRPAVKDRRPLVGWHPEIEHLGIFNGMGSKGVSLIPYFADHFVDHILYKTPLEKEADINRHYSNFQG